jgi:hypothetical protein
MNVRLKLSALLALMALCGCAATATAATRSPSPSRAWKVRVTAPGQFDLALAEVRFGAPGPVARPGARGSLSTAPMRIALSGPTGLDYVAAAVTRSALHGRPRALVLVVNRRPRGSLAPDLARIGLAVTAARSLGPPVVLQLADPFTHPPAGTVPALCNLPTHGVSLAPGDLRSVLSRGTALAPFSVEVAIAQAYDVVCRRPYDPAFRQAVTQAPPPNCLTAQVSIISCCPPNAMCLPPPCFPCACGPSPCAAQAERIRSRAIACPLGTPPVACPL